MRTSSMASSTLYTAIAAILLGMSAVEGARILVIPFYHYSHVNLMGVAGSALRDAGHDVTFLVSETFSSAPEKYKLQPLVFEVSKDAVFRDMITRVMGDEAPVYEKVYRGFTELYPIFGKVCDQVLGNERIVTAVKNGKFDLVLFDGAPPLQCFLVLPYKFDIPWVTINVMTDPWSLGVPTSAAIEPIAAFPTNNQLSFLERLQGFLFYSALSVIPANTMSSSYYVGKYAPEKPLVTAHSLYSKSEMILMNHEIMCLDYPRISMPHYQYIGGSSAKAPKPLPEDIAAFVDGASDGFIVISFGSMPAWQKIWKTLKSKLIYSFAKLPQRVVALYALDDNTEDFPPNVMALKWLPQNDLLGHPNARLFVTHGGNNGQLETTYHGVPSLVLPVGGDQIYNGIRVESHNYGKMIKDYDLVSEDSLLQTFQELLNNDTYYKNVKKCSKIIKSQPSSQERIIFWVNHILEFGGSHLRPPSVDMPLYQVFMLDVLCFTIFMLSLIVFINFMCCRCCIRKCCSSKAAKSKKE